MRWTLSLLLTDESIVSQRQRRKLNAWTVNVKDGKFQGWRVQMLSQRSEIRDLYSKGSVFVDNSGSGIDVSITALDQEESQPYVCLFQYVVGSIRELNWIFLNQLQAWLYGQTASYAQIAQKCD